MGKEKMKILILHAGINHPSPYFYNLCKELKKYKQFEVVISPELPLNEKTENGIVYFNRLKRFYDSNDFNSIKRFLNDVDNLKENGWNLIMTLHNFFPIDRKINKNDEFLLSQFLPKMDIVYTFTNSMKESLNEHFGINSISHSIGINDLDGDFDKQVKIPNFPKDSFIFSFIGNVSEYKNLEMVIKNFEEIDNPNVYLIIAGPESRNYKMNYSHKSNIIRINSFIGKTGWYEIAKITDIFVNTYDVSRDSFKYGFFPSNCIQIMKHKKICLIPNSKFVRELLPINYYYTYNTDKEMLSMMKMLTKKKKEIKRLEKKYPTSKKYSWKNTVNIIVNEIERKFL